MSVGRDFISGGGGFSDGDGHGNEDIHLTSMAGILIRSSLDFRSQVLLTVLKPLIGRT